MDDFDYTAILSTLKELPFSVGKSTLIEILTGAVTKKMVSNTVYMDLGGYGALQTETPARIEQWIERLLANGFIVQTAPPGQFHMRVLSLTEKGKQELKTPTLHTTAYQAQFQSDAIDAQSAALIQQFHFYLAPYNAEQQHAIVNPAKRILCVAGAGTGKTTVLTKRIEFLIKYRGVPAQQILAITFTRKARAEMESRLQNMGVHITTFNGFCERLLRAHKQEKPLLSYGQKLRLFHEVIAAKQLQMHELVEEYFTDGQRKGATKDELERRLIGDVYSILDHYANEDATVPNKGSSPLAVTLLTIARALQEEIDRRGLRDYSGQLRDALALLRAQQASRPHYTHILVDEYQDINVAQQRLLDILAPQHLFVVGDPRQSIFGWRGSHLSFITEFKADCTVQLRTNYRSHQSIVAHMNKLIATMRLADLESAHEAQGSVQTLKYNSEDEELQAIATLLAHTTHTDVFVLARTNRQLQDLSQLLTQRTIKHSIKHEEDEAAASGIVLATVHAIKGLEARTVIVMGATTRYFPCKVSDHPVVDLIKDTQLDREEEERRLLYVAISRAKELLILTYTSTPTYFLDGVLHNPQQRLTKRDDAAFDRLRAWRAALAKAQGLPPYIICSDKTLREVADTHPQTVHELRSIYGLKDTKIRQYGEAMLDALHNR